MNGIRREIINNKLRCGHCGEWKALIDFADCRSNKFGKASVCKNCFNSTQNNKGKEYGRQKGREDYSPIMNLIGTKQRIKEIRNIHRRSEDPEVKKLAAIELKYYEAKYRLLRTKNEYLMKTQKSCI